MSNQQTADAAELYGLEHHFRLGWALAALGACNIGATQRRRWVAKAVA